MTGQKCSIRRVSVALSFVLLACVVIQLCNLGNVNIQQQQQQNQIWLDQWPLQQAATKPKLTRQEEIPPQNKDSYTIVINSFDRFAELARVIPHWRSCLNVHEIQIIHHHPTIPLPSELVNFSLPPFVKVQWYAENKLSNRFRIPATNYDTHWIFSVDDDMFVDCRMMQAAFGFQLQHPDTLVGFEPRLFDWSGQQKTMKGEGYDWDGSCRKTTNCSYNTLWTTKGAFLSIDQLQEYWHERWDPIRTLVDEKITGEDMLMSTVLATQSPSLSCLKMVRTFYRNKQWKGILNGSPITLQNMPTSKGSLGSRTSHHRKIIYHALLSHLDNNSNLPGPKSSARMQLCPPHTTMTWMSVDVISAQNRLSIDEVHSMCPRPQNNCKADDLQESSLGSNYRHRYHRIFLQ